MKTLLTLLLLAAALNLRAVEWQPLKAQVTRVLEALDYQGAALPAEELRTIRNLLDSGTDTASAKKLEELLDKHSLVEVTINPESRVKVARGNAKAELIQG